MRREGKAERRFSRGFGGSARTDGGVEPRMHAAHRWRAGAGLAAPR